jgi:hypothetical protein
VLGYRSDEQLPLDGQQAQRVLRKGVPIVGTAERAVFALQPLAGNGAVARFVTGPSPTCGFGAGTGDAAGCGAGTGGAAAGHVGRR